MAGLFTAANPSYMQGAMAGQPAGPGVNPSMAFIMDSLARMRAAREQRTQQPVAAPQQPVAAPQQRVTPAGGTQVAPGGTSPELPLLDPKQASLNQLIQNMWAMSRNRDISRMPSDAYNAAKQYNFELEQAHAAAAEEKRRWEAELALKAYTVMNPGSRGPLPAAGIQYLEKFRELERQRDAGGITQEQFENGVEFLRRDENIQNSVLRIMAEGQAKNTVTEQGELPGKIAEYDAKADEFSSRHRTLSEVYRELEKGASSTGGMERFLPMFLKSPGTQYFIVQANKALLDAASALKGVLSDKDMDILRDTAFNEKYGVETNMRLLEDQLETLARGERWARERAEFYRKGGLEKDWIPHAEREGYAEKDRTWFNERNAATDTRATAEELYAPK